MTEQVIIQCENCQEYRHKSHYFAGRRFCDAPECQEKEGIKLLDLARRVTEARRLAVAAELDKLLEEGKPETVKRIGWRIVLLRMQGMSPEAIAKEIGTKVGRVQAEEERAMHALHTIALDRMGVEA